MKTLLLVAHPHFAQSKTNARLLSVVPEHVTVRHLYDVYPDGKVDVAAEQQLLLEHDTIVFQFPFYWYSTPALLKEWQDVVLTYGFAYGSEGTKLHGKTFKIVTTAGGPAEAYTPEGYNRYSMEQLLLPLRAMTNLTGLVWSEPFVVHGVNSLTDDTFAELITQYAAYLR